MELVDAHAHLSAPEFDGDRAQILEAAEREGVRAILAVSETVQDAEKTLTLAARHPLMKPCAGLYPTQLDPDAAEAMAELIRRNRDRLVAIGEVGLDHWVVKDEAGREVQRKILARFVDLSHELELPLNVHSRSAGRAAIQFLRDRGARRVLMHAFDGKASAALEGVRAGFFFSIPPSVVRSPQKQKLVRALPMEALLLETDSPVLGADPQVRNEPKNVTVACRAVADLKGLASEEVARITTENARRLFPRAFP